MMNQRISSDGYLICKLSKNNKDRYYFIHRLVAEAFIPNPNRLSDVNHIDFDRKNNCVENLEWISHRENVHYSISEGRHVCCTDLRGEKNPNYGNTKLKERMKSDLELREKTIARIAKYGSDNNKARAVAVFIDGEWIEFTYIGACAEYLIENGYTQAKKLNSVRSNIALSIKNEKLYLGLKFKFI